VIGIINILLANRSKLPLDIRQIASDIQNEFGRRNIPSMLRCTDSEVWISLQQTLADSCCAIVAADRSILRESLLPINANEYWEIDPSIHAVIVPSSPERFKYRYAALQFTPLCYIHYVNMQYPGYGALVSYLLNARGVFIENRRIEYHDATVDRP